MRATIAAADSGDTIAFSAKVSGMTITLTSGELAISKSQYIEGPGANRLSISGNGTGRVFNISGGLIVTIAGLTIADAFVRSDDGGGGILNQDKTGCVEPLESSTVDAAMSTGELLVQLAL
jgi:hypothetical protein